MESGSSSTNRNKQIAMEEFMSMSQEGTVVEYYDEFRFLLDKVKVFEEISEDYATYLFIFGLKSTISDVLMGYHNMGKGLKLEQAFSLARLQEKGLNGVLVQEVSSNFEVSTFDLNQTSSLAISSDYEGVLESPYSSQFTKVESAHQVFEKMSKKARIGIKKPINHECESENMTRIQEQGIEYEIKDEIKEVMSDGSRKGGKEVVTNKIGIHDVGLIDVQLDNKDPLIVSNDMVVNEKEPGIVKESKETETLDLVATIIDELKAGTYLQLLQSVEIIFGRENTINNLARDHYTCGLEIIEFKDLIIHGILCYGSIRSNNSLELVWHKWKAKRVWQLFSKSCSKSLLDRETIKMDIEGNFDTIMSTSFDTLIATERKRQGVSARDNPLGKLPKQKSCNKGKEGFNEDMLELLVFAVKDLRSSLKDLGSNLMIRLGRTESVIEDLVKEVRAANIYTQEEVEYYSRLVIDKVKEKLEDMFLEKDSPKISLWSTSFYDIKDMVDLPLSYNEFQQLKLPVLSPHSAQNLPGVVADLAWGPLPTLDDLKEFMDESPYKLQDNWSLINNTSAEYVLQNDRILMSNGMTNSQSNFNSLASQMKKKRLKKTAFITKSGIFVGGGTNDMLNALAAYLKYFEGTARDDWQELHEKLHTAKTREGALFGLLFGPVLQLGVVSRRRVYDETIQYEKDQNGGFLSPFGYSTFTVASVVDHVCSREWYRLLASGSQMDFTNRYSTRYSRWKGHLLQYAVMGREGPANLLVHGFGAFLEHYRDNIVDIVEGGNRVWTITLLGFGRSEKPNVVYTELMWAELLRSFIIDVVGEPVHLVGNSFGGYFVSIAAGLWPALARSVVLLNSVGHYILVLIVLICIFVCNLVLIVE